MQHHETFTDGPRGRAFFDEALRLSLVDRSQRQHRGGFVFASEKKRQGMTRMKFYEDVTLRDGNVRTPPKTDWMFSSGRV